MYATFVSFPMPYMCWYSHVCFPMRRLIPPMHLAPRGTKKYREREKVHQRWRNECGSTYPSFWYTMWLCDSLSRRLPAEWVVSHILFQLSVSPNTKTPCLFSSSASLSMHSNPNIRSSLKVKYTRTWRQSAFTFATCSYQDRWHTKSAKICRSVGKAV